MTGLERPTSSNALSSSSLLRCPTNLAAFGILFGPEFRATKLHEVIRNDLALQALAVWRFPSSVQYLVLGGELHRKLGGFVGGFAADWPAALRLFSHVSDRFDEIATAQGQHFTTHWNLLLDDERVEQVRTLIATRMQTAGSA